MLCIAFDFVGRAIRLFHSAIFKMANSFAIEFAILWNVCYTEIKLSVSIFLAVGHQFCKDLWIASIKHQTTRSSKERVPQVAQQWEEFGRSF